MNTTKVDLAINAMAAGDVPELDWAFMERSEVVAVVRSAANYAARIAGDGVDSDDLFQQGLEALAVRPELAQRHPGTIYMSVMRFLVAASKDERDVVRSMVPLNEEAVYGGKRHLAPPPDGDTATMGSGPSRVAHYGQESDYLFDSDEFGDTPYPRELVKVLLEAMWNCDVVNAEFAPDADMPRAKPNPSRLGTSLAHKIDMERAWLNATLDLEFRMCARLVYGRGLTQYATAAILRMTPSQVHTRLESGLKALCAHLNGVSE